MRMNFRSISPQILFFFVFSFTSDFNVGIRASLAREGRELPVEKGGVVHIVGRADDRRDVLLLSFYVPFMTSKTDDGFYSIFRHFPKLRLIFPFPVGSKKTLV